MHREAATVAGAAVNSGPDTSTQGGPGSALLPPDFMPTEPKSSAPVVPSPNSRLIAGRGSSAGISATKSARTPPPPPTWPPSACTAAGNPLAMPLPYCDMLPPLWDPAMPCPPPPSSTSPVPPMPWGGMLPPMWDSAAAWDALSMYQAAVEAVAEAAAVTSQLPNCETFMPALLENKPTNVAEGISLDVNRPTTTVSKEDDAERENAQNGHHSQEQSALAADASPPPKVSNFRADAPEFVPCPFPLSPGSPTMPLSSQEWPVSGLPPTTTAASQSSQEDSLSNALPSVHVLSAQVQSPQSPQAQSLQVQSPQVQSLQVQSPQMPGPEAPSQQVPNAEVLITEVPNTEVPSAEVASAEVPCGEAPNAQAPIGNTQVPSTEVPSTDVPDCESVEEALVADVGESSDFVALRARMLCMRQVGHFPPPPGLHLSTIPSSACQLPMHPDPGSEDGRSWSGSTSRLMPNEPSGIMGPKVLHAPSTSHEPSAGAFLLQLVRGQGSGLKSSGSGSSQEQYPTTELGAALLRQLRGEPGDGISSKTRSSQIQGSRAADEGAERGKALLMHLFNPDVGNTAAMDNATAAVPRKAAVHPINKIKSVEVCAGDCNAAGSASVEGTSAASSPDPRHLRASKGAGKAQTRSKIRANAAAARACTDNDGQNNNKSGLGNDGTRRQCAIAAASVDEWRPEAGQAGTQGPWVENIGEIRRAKGKKGPSW